MRSTWPGCGRASKRAPLSWALRRRLPGLLRHAAGAWCAGWASSPAERADRRGISAAAGRRLAVIAAAGERRDVRRGDLPPASPALLAQLAPELPAAYSAQLRRLKSMGAVVMMLALDQPLTQALLAQHAQGAGSRSWRWSSTPTSSSPEHYGGDHLIYCGDYLDPSHEYFRLSEDELLERFLPALKRFNPASSARGCAVLACTTPTPSRCRRSATRATSRRWPRRCRACSWPA